MNDLERLNQHETQLIIQKHTKNKEGVRREVASSLMIRGFDEEAEDDCWDHRNELNDRNPDHE